MQLNPLPNSDIPPPPTIRQKITGKLSPVEVSPSTAKEGICPVSDTTRNIKRKYRVLQQRSVILTLTNKTHSNDLRYLVCGFIVRNCVYKPRVIY